MTEHTKLPWTVYDPASIDDCYPGIDDGDGGTIVLFGYVGEDCGIRGGAPAVRLANAALIVKAVNHHAEMAEALETISKILVPGPHADAKSGMAKALDALDEARDIARALLAKLETTQ